MAVKREAAAAVDASEPPIKRAKLLNTAPGGVSLKAKAKRQKAVLKVKEAKNAKRLAKDHLNPETGPRASDQPLVVSKKRPYEVKGKRAKVPKKKLDPKEEIKVLLEIANNIPEEYGVEVPPFPDTKDIDELINSHIDFEWTDNLKIKVRSIRTGHELPPDVEKLREYCESRSYPLKFKRAAHIAKMKYNLDTDWQPWLKPHPNREDMLFSVLRGVPIHKDLHAIGQELSSLPFKTKLADYLEKYVTKLEKDKIRVDKVRSKLVDEEDHSVDHKSDSVSEE